MPQLKKALPPHPGVLQSILDDPDYHTSSLKWMAQQAYEVRGRPLKLLEPMETERVQKLLDALASKNFEALRKTKQVIGLRVIASYLTGLLRPEFNLLEPAAVYDAEPLVRKAITRQLNLWFKQPFEFVGDDPRLIDYIKKRFKTIAYVSGISTHQLFRDVVQDLLKYSNAFIIKIRDSVLSTGIPAGGGLGPPVAGFFPVNPINMFPRFENGVLTQWTRFLKDGTRFQYFDPKDVIHLTFDRERDFIFGKPRLLGVIEDIAALRRIEENIEVLLAKFLFPVYQLSVGTPEAPCRYYGDGSSELDLARVMVSNMEAEGMLVTSERFKLEVVGAMKEALRAESYLEHFKMRVYTGLGVSPIDMGEGQKATRATADNISQNLKDLVIEDQLDFAYQVQQKILAELFLEHPDKISALNAFDQVRLRFANVDLDNLIKIENHVINKFNNDIITEDEARKEIGRDPFTLSDVKNTKYNLATLPLALIAARDEPFTPEAKKLALANAKKSIAQASGKGLATKPGTGASAQAKKGGSGRLRVKRPGTPASRVPATANQPENVHGKNPGPTKKKSSVEEDLIGSRLANLTTRLLLSNSIDEMKEVISQRFTSPKDSAVILLIVEQALHDCQNKLDLRAYLISEFVGISNKFLDSEEMELESNA
jgi:hypothetical protein